MHARSPLFETVVEAHLTSLPPTFDRGWYQRLDLTSREIETSPTAQAVEVTGTEIEAVEQVVADALKGSGVVIELRWTQRDLGSTRRP